MTRAASRIVLAVGVVAVVSATAMVANLVVSRRSDAQPVLSAANRADPTYVYVIPDGTGDRIDAGDPVDVLPDVLTAHVGEVMRIVNDDDRGHLVGPFYVAAGQTLTQRFDTPGELVGVCSIHDDGRFVLEVLP